ncbi:WD repeat-containing protein 76 isoform X1 [Tripterygium wilfordii]|uniref:WD repeat-containing protein 76 isoform X1 n=1 Tax=Tripterygium wilfordii TaxID=458696 RepID=A0A7J7DA50_TRIWF|nr:WD repeat-containing protein 76-like [Tripterygium wilfordii]KAF5743164.1 WD repeat-containing protein 76 isoform X1 [Tripterygium wilfordii]
MVLSRRTKKPNEYERKRLENLKRNAEKLASLNVHTKATQFLASSNLQRSRQFYSEKKPKIQKIPPERKSLRARGIPPEISGSESPGSSESPEQQTPTNNLDSSLRRCLGPISMSDVFIGIKSKSHYTGLVDKISGFSKNAQSVEGNDSLPLNLESFQLKPENIVRVVPGDATLMRFLPCVDAKVIVVGNRSGHVGFWDVDKEKRDGVYCYQPHIGCISGISVQPSSLSKIYTSCDGGFIRMMDAEKEVFNLVYSSDQPINYLSHHPTNVNYLYFGEGHGGLSTWDNRGGRSAIWNLHTRCITSIDFNSKNPYIMATSSIDGDACIWDLRSMDACKPKTVKIISHRNGVYSACFSPSGSHLAIASAGNALSILGGVEFDDYSLMCHDHKAGDMFSFRAIWGWDDSHVLIGNREGGIDVMSSALGQKIATLESPCLSTILHQLDAHPYQAGVLAGSAGINQALMWTSC